MTDRLEWEASRARLSITHADSSLPYRRLLSPRTALVAVLCWGPAQTLLLHVAGVVRGAASVQSLLRIALTLGAGALAGIWALGASTRAQAANRAGLAVFVGGLVNVLLGALISDREPVREDYLIGIVGAQALFELLFSGWCALLVYGVHPHARASSDERADRVLFLGAIWLALPLVPIDLVAWGLESPSPSKAELALSALLRIVVPLGAALWVVARAAGRRRWLQRVARGEEPSWRLLDRPGAVHSDLPRLDASDGESDRTLVRVRIGGEAFRTAEYEEVAVVGAASESAS